MSHHPLFSASDELVVILPGPAKLLEFFPKVDLDPLLLSEVLEARAEDAVEARVDIHRSLFGTPYCPGSSLVEMPRYLARVPCDWRRVLACSS
jgi:hypothetical protein